MERIIALLGDYVILKKKNYNLQIILSFIEHFRDRREYFVLGPHNKTLVYLIEMFRKSLSIDRLKETYDKIKFNELECTDGLYGYFVFQIFLLMEKVLK